jgi:selenocysteine-specific elongation factor
MHVVGTAGHVDHGKSSLVEALTGTNPDRWTQERERGMTLDLGFARLVLEGGVEAGIVDVPGHERFLHNMLAGAAGMDVLLLVVAANEGVMPQTREHLDVLGYLNVRRTIVAISKIDLVAPEERTGALQSIARDLQSTIARDADTIAFSSVTGEGLDRLRAALLLALRSLSPLDAAAPAYLPVDRVFALPGLGTIVTGTLMQGSVATGDALKLEPSGKTARVRGIHVFGTARERVPAGSRVALNVAGVDRAEISRGEAVVGRELSARDSFTVRFTPLPSAAALLRRRTPVRAYVGSAEMLGTLIFESVPRAGETARAELHLRARAVAFPGLRFVVRRPSPKTLLGGGFVEGVAAPSGFDHAPTAAGQAVLAALRERGLDAVDVAGAAAAANVRHEVAQAALDELATRDEVLALRRPAAYVYGAAARELLVRVIAQIEERQREEPWSMGVTSLTLARSLAVPESLLVRVLAEFADGGKIAVRAGYYAMPDYRPALTPEQEALFAALVPVDEASPCLPAIFNDVNAAVRASGIAGAAKAFDTLLARGALVKVGGDLYRGSQIAMVRARVEDLLRRQERMTAAEFRDAIGTSRKYAVPLLEWLDARGVTLRSGDHRTLRKKSI